MKFWLKLIIIITAIGLLIFGGMTWSKANQEKKDAAARKFQTISLSSIEKKIDLSGNVNIKKIAQLRFASGGKIISSPYSSGDYIKRGQSIATIDARILKKQLEQSLNNYSIERLSWDQQLDDIKDRAIDKKEERMVDKNQYLLNNSVIGVELSSISISNTVMDAPFSGVLISSPVVSPGYYISPSESYVLADPATLIFTALISEEDLAQVQIGQDSQVKLDAYQGELYDTKISNIAYQSTTKDGSPAFSLEFPLGGEGRSLEKFRLGLGGHVGILQEKKSNIIAIDPIAIVEKDGKKIVKIKGVKENELVEKEITTGLETDALVEVISGLQVGDELLIEG